MPIATTVRQYLDAQRVSYEVLVQEPAESLIQTAKAGNIPARQLARAVVLKRPGQFVMAVLPLSHVLDFSALRRLLDHDVVPASVEETAYMFPDCEQGTLPPLGEAYGLTTLVDESLAESDPVYFEPGERCMLVRVSRENFRRLHRESVSGSFAVPAEDLSSCDLQPLESAVRRAAPCGSGVSVAHLIPSADIRTRIGRGYRLPSMPDGARRILGMQSHGTPCVEDAMQLVEADSRLAAQATAYACIHGDGAAVASARDAVAALGPDLITHMALGLALGRSLKSSPDGPLGLHEFWRHAVFAASLVQRLAADLPKPLRPRPGTAYLAALLHDIGFLMLGHLFPPEFYLLNNLARAHPEIPVTVLEHNVLGMGSAQEVIAMGHTKLGAWLLQSWGVPREVTLTALEHHDEDYRDDWFVLPNLVLLADRLLKRNELGGYGLSGELPATVLKALGLREEQAEASLEALTAQQDALSRAARELVA